MGDLSPRAVEVLNEVVLVAVEDTRRTRILFNQFGIVTPMIAYHEHNESRAAEGLIKRLERGDSLALVSDAGTPTISDPGYEVVSLAHHANVPVRSVPGPCAVTAALSVSGLPTDRFLFLGFPPPKRGKRRSWLKEYTVHSSTLVLYESCHRIASTARDLVELFGAERSVCVVRELTKIHEQIHRCDLGALGDWLKQSPYHQKGEFVLVVAGADKARPGADLDAGTLLSLLQTELPAAKAAKLTAKITGVSRRELYGKTV